MIPKILILDGKFVRSGELRRFLENQGYQVYLATNGRMALEMVEKTAFDLLLVDPCAAGEDGLELIKHLRRSHPDLPQIVVSGPETGLGTVEVMRAGAYEIVVEPMENLSELGFAVGRGLEWRRLGRERARYRSLIHNFPGIVFWGTSLYVIELIHGRVKEITGYYPEAFTEGRVAWATIIHPDDLMQALLRPWQHLLQGEPAKMEYRLERLDGTSRWVECTLTPTMDEDGKVQNISGIVLDISERKRTEMALSEHLCEQETLFAIGQLVSSSLQIDEVMQLVAEYMTRLVDATGCAISDWDPETGTLTVRARYVRSEQTNTRAPVNEIGRAFLVSEYPVMATALRERKPFVVYVDDPEADPQKRQLLQRYDRHGVAGVPLMVRDRVIGLAEVYLAEGARPFGLHDLRLLQALANQVAVTIDNARLFATVQTSEAALHDLSLRLINVQEQERRHIAQELHDELGQILTATKINIDLARRRLSQQAGRQQPDEVTSLQRRLDEASALTDKVLTNVRAMTVELRPTLLDDLGIVPTLRWYLGRFAESTGIQVQLEAPELPARLQPEIETTIYRGVQEALTNVVRHAQASRVRVWLACSEDTVTTVVEDDGKGFDVRAWSERPSGHQTLGLTGIQERVMLLDGRVTITSQPREGTRIETELPARFRSGEEQ
jgi:PAS domain S-box-containing protein